MASDSLDDALDQRIAELQAQGSSQAEPAGDGAAATPPPAPPEPPSTPATTAPSPKEAAGMAELEEVLQRLLQPLHDKVDQMGNDLASRLASSEDGLRQELSKVSTSIVTLRSQLSAVASAAGASPMADPEMVEKAKEHLEQDFVKGFDVPDQIRIVTGLLKKDFAGRTDAEIDAAVAQAGEEVD